ncbi:MAG: hypothetical protein ABSD73_09205 [Candidatus Bathyarchaeia archaeon]
MSTWPLEGTTPLIADRFINTYIAGEDLLAVGVFVEITADNTVKKCTTQNSTKIAGVTLTKAYNGQKISIVARGRCRIVPYSSLSAGDQFGSAASGGTAIQDNSSKNATILGVCVQGGNSAGTAICDLW